jgi:hypothetical protein
MGLHISCPFLLRLIDDVLDDINDSVQGELIFSLVQDVHALLNESILNCNLLFIHVFIKLVIDFDQEIDSLGHYFGILALQGYIPDYIKLIKLVWVGEELEYWLFVLFFLCFVILLLRHVDAIVVEVVVVDELALL